MKFKAYDLIQRAVAEGVVYGVNRSYKHTAALRGSNETPDIETLRDNIEQEVMNALSEIIEFSDEAESIYAD